MMKIATIITEENAIRVRETPELNGKVLFSIPKDEQLIITDKIGEWSKILYGGRIGYVMTCFLKETAYETINMSKEELKNLGQQIESLLTILKRIYEV